jgi:hypothetical protein
MVDFDDVVQKEKERTRKQLLEPLRSADDFVLERDEYEAALDDVATAPLEQQRRFLHSLGVIRESGDVVVYRPAADPWRDPSEH